MNDEFLALPPLSYPRFAPLSLPMIKHLIIEEYRWSHKTASSRQVTPEHVWADVERRVREARTIVYEYMNPFIVADTGSSNGHDRPRAFPSEDWLLRALEYYTPKGKRNAPSTLDYWQKRRLLRRDKPRGPFDLTSVSALLVARVAEKEHQRNWLPTVLEKDEPHWWCHGWKGLEASSEAIPLPLPSHIPPATFLWTPWIGASWTSKEWQVVGNTAIRWAGEITSEQEIERWSFENALVLRSYRNSSFFEQDIFRRMIHKASEKTLYDVLAKV